MTLTMRSITLNSGSDKLLRVVVTAVTNIVTSRLAWSQQPDHKRELNFKTSIPSVHHLLTYFYQQLLSQIKKKQKHTTYNEASYVSGRKGCFLFNKIISV